MTSYRYWMLFLLGIWLLACPWTAQAEDQPDYWYDYDVNSLQIPGDITDMFRHENRWVIVSDSSWLYSFNSNPSRVNLPDNHWWTEGHIAGDFFYTDSEVPLLVDPDEEVILIEELGSQSNRGALDLKSVYVVPKNERIHTALAFRTRDSVELMRRVEEMGHSSEGFPYDYVLGGEIKENGKWTSLLLVKEALEENWRRIALSDSTPVLNLTLVRDQYRRGTHVLFTQREAIKLMHEDDFNPWRCYLMPFKKDSILSVESNGSTALAGTAKGRILWADDVTRGWRLLFDDLQDPVIDISDGFLITAAENRNQIWKYNFVRSGIHDEITDLELEYIFLPSRIWPLTTFAGRLICGEDGYIAQLKTSPLVERWLSSYREPMPEPAALQPAAVRQGSVSEIGGTDPQPERRPGKTVRYLDPDPLPEPEPDPPPDIIPVDPRQEPVQNPVQPQQTPGRKPVEPKPDPVKKTDEPEKIPARQTDKPKPDPEPVKKTEEPEKIPAKQTDKPKKDPAKKQNQPK